MANSKVLVRLGSTEIVVDKNGFGALPHIIITYYSKKINKYIWWKGYEIFKILLARLMSS